MSTLQSSWYRIVTFFLLISICVLFQGCEFLCSINPDFPFCTTGTPEPPDPVYGPVEDNYIPISIQLFDADFATLKSGKSHQPQNINVRIYDPKRQLRTGTGIPVVRYKLEDTLNVLTEAEGVLHTQSGFINLRLPKSAVGKGYTFTINIREPKYFEVIKQLYITSTEPVHSQVYMLSRENYPDEVGSNQGQFKYSNLTINRESSTSSANGRQEKYSINTNLTIPKGTKIIESTPILRVPTGGFSAIDSPFKEILDTLVIPIEKRDLKAGMVLSRYSRLEEGAILPENIVLPEDFILPKGVQLPEDIVLPRGLLIPEGTVIPRSIRTPFGVQEAKAGTRISERWLPEFTRNSGIVSIDVFDTRSLSVRDELGFHQNAFPSKLIITNGVNNQDATIANLNAPIIKDVLAYIDYNLYFNQREVKKLSQAAMATLEIKSTSDVGNLELWSQDSRTGQWKLELPIENISRSRDLNVTFPVQHFSRYAILSDSNAQCDTTITKVINNVGFPQRSRTVKLTATQGNVSLWHMTDKNSVLTEVLTVGENKKDTLTFIGVPREWDTSFKILEGTDPSGTTLDSFDLNCNTTGVLDLPRQGDMRCEQVILAFSCPDNRVQVSGVALTKYTPQQENIATYQTSFEDGIAAVSLTRVGNGKRYQFTIGFDDIDFYFSFEVKTKNMADFDNENVKIFEIQPGSSNSGFTNFFTDRTDIITNNKAGEFCDNLTIIEFTTVNGVCDLLNAISDNQGGTATAD